MVVRAVRARRGLLHHSSAAALAAKLNGCGAGSGVTNTKQIELAIKDQDKRLATLTEQAGKDTGLTWEMVGADYIFLDEAHYFKNRERVSAVRELACTPGSQQAEDLVMKLDVLRESRRDAAAAAGYALRPGQERVATFSTGTPVANSLGEMWVMQSYLRPDLLADAGVADVDGWGAVFTGTTSGVEMNASGSRLAPVTRVGRFVNVPELVTMSSVYTDVVTRADITVALPELVGGARQVISKPASQEVRDFISDLAYRSEHFDPGRPDIDNSLKVANDGRNVSLDERMANLEEPLDGGRIGMVAGEIMRIHTDTERSTYRDQAGGVSAVPGGLQIVFCDRSTPHQTGGKFSLYEGLRDELVERGMAEQAIRFIHDYPRPGEKAQLFNDCRAGRVSVLVGSTEKMGTGTNIQDRAVALHHVDVPWRPADLEQREGRILRQGNQNPRVEILNYVTEETWDTVMWLLNRTNRRGSRARRRSLSRSVRPPIGRGVAWALSDEERCGGDSRRGPAGARAAGESGAGCRLAARAVGRRCPRARHSGALPCGVSS